MRHVVLIACGKRKSKVPTSGRELYQGDLFRKSLAYAESLNPSAIYVLSAKHGLLELDREVEPYDQTLKTMGHEAVKVWASHVLEQLHSVSNLDQDDFTILAAEKYRRYLIPHLPHHDVPL